MSREDLEHFEKLKNIYMKIQRELFMMDASFVMNEGSFANYESSRSRKSSKGNPYESLKDWMDHNLNLVVGGALIGLGLLFLLKDLL